MSNRVNAKNIVVALSMLIAHACTESKNSVSTPPPTPVQPVSPQPPPPVPAPAPVAATAVEKVVEKKPLPTVDSLAELKERKNNVEFRGHDESIWARAEIGREIFRYDALQTQASSLAKVIYLSGSQLDVKENTLLVFDHDPGLKKKHSEDRVIVKNGQLVGTTKTELWVFTNAGLVQIKAPKEAKVAAKTEVTIKEGNQLSVKVDTGRADVIVKTQEKFEKIEVAPHSDLKFVSTGNLLSAATATDGKLDEKNLETIVAAATAVKTAAKAELVIDSPKNDLNTDMTSFEVKGRVTGPGAKLLINGELIALKDDFSFSKIIPLNAGANLVVFQLIRSDASVQFSRKNIRRN